MRPEFAVVRRTIQGSARAGRPWVRAGLAAATIASLAGCTAGQRAGDSPAYVIIQQLQAASGAQPDKLSNVLASDVVTLVGTAPNQVPTIYADNGQVQLLLALKNTGLNSDPNNPGTATAPTTTNFITLTRYHVDFVRTDGRSQQGVDVPYSFDGAITATVTDQVTTANFTLVRAQAKEEAPLKQLVAGGGAIQISTLATVTFYGADQAGHAVTVTGQISVNFADWGDPQSSS